MKTKFMTVDDILNNETICPLPLEIIPNYLGINLCSVEGITWTKQEDGQLVNLIIHFNPSSNNEDT